MRSIVPTLSNCVFLLMVWVAWRLPLSIAATAVHALPASGAEGGATSSTEAASTLVLNGQSPSSVAATPSTHSVSRIRGLQATETMQDADGELVFRWNACSFCDAYNVSVRLRHVAGDRLLLYTLKSGVTSLRIGKVWPRTKYHMTIKAIPSSDVEQASHIEGVTRSSEAPPAVRELVVSPISNSSLRVEWTSSAADFFSVKVFGPDSALVQESQWPFARHSTIRISQLQPATLYDVHVTAVYEPLSERSAAPVVAEKVKTLPSEFPNVQFRLEKFDGSRATLLWSNPSWPVPVTHNLACVSQPPPHHDSSCKKESLFDADLSGLTESLSLLIQTTSRLAACTNFSCTLRTSYSSELRVVSEAEVFFRIKQAQPIALSIRCRSPYSHYRYNNDYDAYTIDSLSIQAFFKEEAKLFRLPTDALRIQFDSNSGIAAKHSSKFGITYQYSVCKQNTTCSKWQNVSGEFRDDKKPEIQIRPCDVSAWISYTLKYRLQITCPEDTSQNKFTQEKFLQLPELPGTVPPVKALAVSLTESFVVVSWEYDSEPVKIDYFLLTTCISDHRNRGSSCSNNNSSSSINNWGERESVTCLSESIPPANRSTRLSSVERGRLHFIMLQAGKVHRESAYISEPRITSFYAPSQAPSNESISVSLAEITDTPDVQVSIAYNASDEVPDAIEFHINVCGRRLRLWEGDGIDSLVEASKTCQNATASRAKPTLTLNRHPWTSYELTVRACYGSFDSTSSANATLPVYRTAPSPLASLSWDEEHGVLSWTYRGTWLPSGFQLSFCKSRDDPPDSSIDIEAGPLDRQYHVSQDILLHDEMVVFVWSFVTFEGTHISGPRSELVLTKRTSRQASQFANGP